MSILKNDLPIGFFDSGVGGLTVLKRLKDILPNENIIFFGDSAHIPYGEKTKEQLLKYSSDILELFYKKGCKAVVMACNTTSSLIYDDIKDLYDFRLYPVVQSVAKMLSELNVNRLGIFATKATINSMAYPNEIHKYNPDIKVFGQCCQNWVNIVENNLTDNPESIYCIAEDLNLMLKNNPDKIVLGCTHYPYLLPILSKFAPSDIFIDPSISFAKYIKADLSDANLLNNSANTPTEEFYVSSNPEQFKKSAKMFYNLEHAPILVNFK